MQIHPIAHIRTDFPEKFGVPRQSGVAAELAGRVVFLPEYRSREALRGIEGFSHLWLIWQFSMNPAGKWSPTVRPPRLGGNERVGVFACRSPFRPNPLGLSCVRLEGVDWDAADGPALLVRGADMVDGTPVFDVKPYLPSADCVPEAQGGFADDVTWEPLRVDCPAELLRRVPEGSREALLAVLAADPRPQYHRDPERVYGMGFAGVQVRFTVGEGVVKVVDIG